MLTIIEHSIVLILAEFICFFLRGTRNPKSKIQKHTKYGSKYKKTTVFGGFIGAVDGI